MTKDEAEQGPRYKFTESEDDNGFVAYEVVATGTILWGLAEHVRLANADAEHGERPRARGDYAP